MLWFSKERKRKMEFIQNYVPTSKAQLLQVAMFLNKGNIEKAQEMFDFYAKNLDLPDFDPVAPTFMQQVKANASGIFGWVKENQSDIMQGYEFLRSMIQNKGALPSLSEAMPTENPLPPINE
jgi:hypothetical protein